MHYSIQAYLHGAFHDGTSNRYHHTFRFCQKEPEWLEMLQDLLNMVNCKAWIYREGKTRNLFTLETTAKFLAQYQAPSSFTTPAEKIAYIRGYFDAEGGIPSRVESQFYIQFCQKNAPELTELKQLLQQLDISTGSLHCPSYRVDPDYYRFFVSAKSFDRFIRVINSWHPRKKILLDQRMKI